MSNKILYHSKEVAREMLGRCKALGRLMEQLRSSLGAGKEQLRSWLEINILFPRWEQNIPTLGTKHSHPGNKTALRLASSEITSRCSRDFSDLKGTECGVAIVSSVMSLRLVVTLLLMLVVGVSDVKAQTDYSGIYYIASDGNAYKVSGKTNESYTYNPLTPETNFYLVPANNPDPDTPGDKTDAFFDGATAETPSKPFLTTYKVGQESEPNWSEAVWVIRQVTDNDGTFYYIMHAETGKYVIYQPFFNDGKSRRKCMHLDSTSPSEAGKFLIEEYKSGVYDIVPKSMRSQKISTHKFWNLADRNRNSRHGLDKDFYYGGLVGLYSYQTDTLDINSRWKFEKVVPKVSSTTVDQVELTFPVTSTTTKIHYTIDGSNPTGSSTEYTSSTNLNLPAEGNMIVKAIAVVSDGVTPTPNTASSEVATLLYKPDITLSQSTYTYNGGENKPTVTAVSIGTTTADASTYTAPTYSEDVTNAGTPIVTVTDADETDNWYIWNASKTFTINQKEVGLTWTPNPAIFTYNGVGQSPTATATGLIGSDACTVTVGISANSGSALTGDDAINVGGYTATATALSNANYALPAERTQTFNIVQKDVTISGIAAANKEYDKTTSATLVYTGVTFGGLIEGDALTVTASGAFADANAGNGKTVNISDLALGGTSVANYKLSESGQQTTTTADITKKNVTITSGITAEDKVYDGTTTATLDCSTAVIDGVLTGDELTVTAITGSFNNKNVGEDKTVIITGFTLSGTGADNYQAATTGNQSTITANITQLGAVLLWGNDALTYNATAQTPTVTVTNAIEGDDVTVTVTGAQMNVGDNYTATASALSDTNYKLPTEGLTHAFTISPAALTIVADAQTKAYGDADPALTYTATGFQGSETTDVMTGSLVRTEGNDVGEYDISQGTLDASNYTITFTGAKFTINPKTLTITADAKSKAYGDADPELTYTSEGLINDDAITGALTRVEGENAGTYAINQGTLSASTNYTIYYIGANLTINKLELIVTANDRTITYGDAPASNGVTYEGFLNNETTSVLGGTIDYDISYEQYGDVGDYAITPKGLTSDNYEITYAAGTLTVNPKEVGLMWENTEFTYNEEIQAPTATATGLVNNDEIGVTVSGGQKNAGNNYTATASALTGEKKNNYVLPESKTQSFTILRKSIGEGSLVSGYTLDFGEGNSILLRDDDIGRALVFSTDYSVGDDEDTSDKYSKRTVSGIGNYEGSFEVRNAVISFTTDANQDEWSATFAAEKANATDIGLALPEGITAYIISDVRGEWAIPEPLDYIPEGVPVLLIARQPVNGFVATEAESENVTLITDDQKARNMLEEVTEATPGYDADTESAPFSTKQIYVLYKNEFVFNKAGNMKKGKVYLNPNHTVASSSPAPARLQIAWNHVTGIDNLQDGRIAKMQDNVWYTIDGRRLSGKPDAKGLYIVDGKKTVIK